MNHLQTLIETKIKEYEALEAQISQLDKFIVELKNLQKRMNETNPQR